MNELKDAIDKAQSVLIALPAIASDRDYFAALQIQRIAPSKTHLLAPISKEEEWQAIFGLSLTKKEFAIMIDTSRSPVEDLRYEKNGDHLTIILSYHKKFDAEAVSMEERIPASDLVITVGFSSRKEAEQFVEKLPHISNARHVWFGADTETPSLQKKLPQKLPMKSAQLLGRILARSREEEDVSVLWSFITHEDFTKTLLEPSSIPTLAKSLAEIIDPPKALVIVWQLPDSDQVSGVVWSRDQRIIEAASTGSGSIIPTTGEISLLPSFENFVDAEHSIRKLLRDVL